jgi:hypothetical protein
MSTGRAGARRRLRVRRHDPAQLGVENARFLVADVQGPDGVLAGASTWIVTATALR